MLKPALTLHRLELFLAVLDTGGVARAARTRHISQPAVTEHLRGLEAFLELTLFERAGRGVRPTAAARALEPLARQAVQAARLVERAARELREVRSGSLVLGASSTPGTYVLPALVGQFRARHAGVTVTLRIENSHTVERWVLDGSVDLGVIGEFPLLDGLTATPWIEDRLVLIVPRRHRLAARRRVSPAQLAGETLIVREEGSSTQRVADRYLAGRGGPPSPAMALGSTEAIREAVAGGLGVAIVSELAVPKSDRRIRTVRLAGGPWRRHLLIIERRGVGMSPAAGRFREFLLHS
ncbi:MAG TPA: LysR family transcriptional regulator [Gemmatimonadales bacterium]|nr:LysR family transcriptional regulator [Gemmatimonadales bacterium]